MAAIFEKKVLMIFGNSHLNAFRRCFDRIINKDQINFDIHYVISGLLKVPWGDFGFNKYLRHLEYEDNIAPSIDLRSRRYKVDIVLVGMGMLGCGIFTPYGPVKNVPIEDQDNVKAYTPRLPLLPGIDEKNRPVHTTEQVTEAEAGQVYEKYYRHKLNKINNLITWGKYQSLHWIPEPDMIESVGRLRFGEDLVDSGLYARHKQIGSKVIMPLISEYGFDEKIIYHPEEYLLPSGFTDDRFRPSRLSADHHVSPNFYQHSAIRLAERLGIPTLD